MKTLREFINEGFLDTKRSIDKLIKTNKLYNISELQGSIKDWLTNEFPEFKNSDRLENIKDMSHADAIKLLWSASDMTSSKKMKFHIDNGLDEITGDTDLRNLFYRYWSKNTNTSLDKYGYNDWDDYI